VKRTFSSWFLILILAAGTSLAMAQSATTSLRGSVKDPSGALVPGATVDLTDSETGTSYHATTNSSGFYIFPVVTPAHYLITVESRGFAVQKRTAELLVNQPATLDFTLSVKAEAITVDVSSTTQTLNLTDATIGNSVGNATIQALPMEGRDPVSLLSLQPGVLYFGADTGTADSRQGAVAGGRSDQGNVTLDGLDDNDQLNGTAFAGVLRSTLDSTEEFRVTTSNGTAEAGRSSGAQVNLVTKAGTNNFHGALYEYYRPTNTVANDFFNKNNEVSSGEPNTPQHYVQNVFGGSVGGPIKKDKLFFFFNYEGLRRAIDQVVQATVPTSSFMGTSSTSYNGVLQYIDANNVTHALSASQVSTLDAPCTSPGNYFNGATTCPWGSGGVAQPGADPNLLSYLATEPTATGSAAGDGLNSGSYYFASPTPLTQNTSIFKLDYNLNSANKIFARGNLQKDTTSGAENLPGQGPASFTDDNTKGFSVGHTWTPTANIVNDLRYGFIRQGYQNAGQGKGDYVFIRFYTQPTAQTRNTIEHVPVHNVVDTLNWTRKTHTFSFGGNWRQITNEHGTDANSFNNASTNPYWPAASTLPDPANLGLPSALNNGFSNSYEIAYSTLVGDVSQLTNVYNYKVASPTTATALPDGSFVQRNFRSNEFEWFVQDSWRMRPNLTLTYGVRHTLLQTPYEMNGQQVSPTIDTDAWYKGREAAAQQGQIYEPIMSFAPSGKANGAPGLFPKQKDNFAPRVGIVYSPDAKTSIRAGAGIYFDHYGEGLVNSFDQEGSFGLSTALSNAAGAYGFENSPRFTGEHVMPAYPLPAVTPTQTFPYAPPAGLAAGFGIDWGVDNKLKTPYSESYNLSLQRELPHGFTVEADYVGRLGRHLLEQLDLAEPVNYVDPGGGGSYFAAAAQLSHQVDVNGAGPASVNAIPYFENVFPFMKNFDYVGESATQAIYTNEWAPLRDSAGETFALFDLDIACSANGEYPNCPTTPKFWNSQFSSLYAWDTIGNSSYNALQLTLRHPTAHGLTLDFSYTFSKSLDMNSGTERANEIGSSDNGFTSSAIQNTWNPKLNKAVSDFDTKHLITADWVYQLPVGRGKHVLGNSNRILDAFVGGWQWAGLARWTSGLPYSFFQAGWATDWQLEGFGVQTENIKFKKTLNSSGLPMIFDSTTQATINNGIAYGSPLRNPYPGEEGERNGFRGDGYFDIDSSLTKSWAIGDWAKLKFAGEIYNVSNTPRFDVAPASLNTGMSSGTLGTYGYTLATQGYRRMQLGLRVDF
jgi:hypothetical protein